MTARHSGKIGDLIFSLPVAKALGVDTFYLPFDAPEVPDFWAKVVVFLYEQPWIKGVFQCTSGLGYMEPDPFHKFDFDFDLHRTHLDKGGRNMVLRYADVFKVSVDPTERWLNGYGFRPMRRRYALFNVTLRHRGVVDWEIIFETEKEFESFFIGTDEEHSSFQKEIGHIIPHLKTNDLWDFARLIFYSEKVYCNQTSSLALAQGFGVPYWWERKPGKTNCVFNTEWQHEIPV